MEKVSNPKSKQNARAVLFGMFSVVIIIITYLLVGFLGSYFGFLQWEQLGPKSGLFQRGVCAFAAFYGGFISGRILEEKFIIRGMIIGVFTICVGIFIQYNIADGDIDVMTYSPALLSAIAGAYIGNMKLRG